MRKERHKRKEVFSVLMISNTGRDNKRYRVSLFTLRLVVILLFLVCAAAGGLSFWAFRVIEGQAKLEEQLSSQEQLSAQLREENERLSGELAAVTEALDASEETEGISIAEESKAQEPEALEDENHPNRFPSSGVAGVVSSYSQENPYMSFDMQVEDSVIATQDGIVVGISSDDNYPHVVEMEHEGGYRTRYMCSREADLKVQEGDQLEAGADLLIITMEDTQLDYQVFLNDEPIDPINLIDAKG